MRRIEPHTLWIGHSGDLGDIRLIRQQGFVAVVDLAINEAPRTFARETAYLRFPLHDGAGNSRGMLAAAIVSVMQFVQRDEPVLVCCSAGMSRSVLVTAAAISMVRRVTLEEAVTMIATSGPVDIALDLKSAVAAVLNDLSTRQTTR